MASPSGGGARSLFQVGRALLRSVRLRRERAMSAILHVGISKAALALRCFSSQVELQPPLRLPAYPSSAQSSQEDQERPGPSYLGGSGLGSKSVVSLATEHVHRSSTQTASSGGSSVAAAGDGPPPEPVQPPPSCVEIEQQQLTAFAIPPEVCNVILAARRPSTKTVYACHWNTFVAWVSELQALSLKPPYLSVHPDKVVLRTSASFLPKVVTPFHEGQSITLPTFYAPPHPSYEEERLHRLDPKRALAFYLNRTKDFRVDDQLFVGYVGAKKGKAVQKRTISR
ncbi:hypothetical protein NDU88_006610 [Pleurodeles waltl]|uniref:Uncharacterized protein n=1 Tax=Pleurodeles waltl TaxID=8319 RepID=A0AAV7VS22_PLEWA|nr:hypothetical protein NDU88_006610 [Pleurodeles waltl]